MPADQYSRLDGPGALVAEQAAKLREHLPLGRLITEDEAGQGDRD